jgi:hypothetical protein
LTAFPDTAFSPLGPDGGSFDEYGEVFH